MFITLGCVILALLLLYALRRPLLRCVGNVLIDEDELSSCETLFVLSGGPNDRSKEAARLLQQGWAPYVICTGESVHRLFEVIDVHLDEAELTHRALINEQVSDSLIVLIHKGTSTREECGIILDYCREKNLKKVMVLSDKFHTNRIDYAFRDRFEAAGVELVLRGAPSGIYEENNWWATEAGLLMVNNEYVKLFYYYLHY